MQFLTVRTIVLAACLLAKGATAEVASSAVETGAGTSASVSNTKLRGGLPRDRARGLKKDKGGKILLNLPLHIDSSNQSVENDSHTSFIRLHSALQARRKTKTTKIAVTMALIGSKMVVPGLSS